MAIDFSGDLDALYADTGVAATYGLALGGSSTITAIEGELGDRSLDLSGVKAHGAGAVFSVRVAEVTAPAREDTITIAGRPVATVRSSELSQDRLEWVCKCQVSA